ncbi:hypothetical protein [Pseudochrobactrum saccharolyticum]|uniref:hypothetical protein n=1 Tax=Pseudochrobactrum saccharolyticum TaxID=354352 RepID=UPI00277A513C|nr:hypothetical protein [Pseudochrobactrum saccharolyticum]MDP8250857.1 hypothetical protein [Pseudochrobactrum saccharolyticum]
MKTNVRDYDEYIASLTEYLSNNEKLDDVEREDAEYIINSLNSCRAKGLTFTQAILLTVNNRLGINGEDLQEIQAALDAGIDVFGELEDNSDDSDFHVKI